MNTPDARSLSPQSQEDLRRRVVRAVVEGGMRKADAVRNFGVSKTAVHNWVKAFCGNGEKSLRAKKRGRKPRSTLPGHQAATAVRMIHGAVPEQLKLPFALWTREALRCLLAKKFGLNISISTAGRYLKRWGFTPQKPVRRAYEQDPVAVRRWLDEEYPAIKRRAKREGAQIHFGDEMGARSDHQVGRSWGRKGETPVIPGTGKRFGCNMISTVTNRGQVAFMVFAGRFNSEVLVTFLGRLRRHARRKVFLIVDSHPAHKSARTRHWVATHGDEIALFFLPPYSPELNPDELLNQDVKSNAVGRRRARDQSELMQNLRGYLRSTQRQPDIVRNYFQEQHVRYAAE